VHLVSFVKVFGLLSIHFYKDFVVRCVLHFTATTTTNRFTRFFLDHPGEPVPEENFWTLWCKGRLTRQTHFSAY